MKEKTLKWHDDKGRLHRINGPAYVEPNRIEKWYKHGKLHRTDGPAKTTPKIKGQKPHWRGFWGMEKWYLDGVLHRDDGPAVILGNGIKKWFVKGVLHRDDDPAVEYPNGGVEYWNEGILHREGGPAIETDSIKAWFIKGRLHRDDGPALIFSPRDTDDKNISVDRYRVYQIIQKFHYLTPIAKAKEEQWWCHGKLHRQDGPAIEYGDSTVKWFSNGKLHRDNAPAVLYPNGSKEWWNHGRLHRKDGPAVEVSEGYFIFHQGTKDIRSYSRKNPRDKQLLLRRMEAIELPISEIDKTETRKPYVNRGDVITYRLYQDRGECHIENEEWVRGKKIISMKRILIIGGYGNFGSYISKTLAKENNITVIIAGRSVEKAQSFIQTIEAANTPEAVALDITKNFNESLQTIKPDIVIHTSGPFQAQGYDVAESCIKAGVHYIDLADARGFVAGIVALNDTAKKNKVLALSGASSVPCLTSALVDYYLPEFEMLESLDYGITTAQKTNRGLATTAAILGYCGKSFKTLVNGKVQDVYGWQSLHVRKYSALGRRLLGNCDVPDLELFPARYPSLKNIRFYAGLEIPFIHIGLWALSGLVRIGLIRNLPAFAPFLLKSSFYFDWAGSDVSGFHMELSGKDESGADKTITFELIARSGHGPYIPCMPAILITKKLAGGEITMTGAQPCVGLITLDEYLGALKDLDISWTN